MGHAEGTDKQEVSNAAKNVESSLPHNNGLVASNCEKDQNINENLAKNKINEAEIKAVNLPFKQTEIIIPSGDMSSKFEETDIISVISVEIETSTDVNTNVTNVNDGTSSLTETDKTIHNKNEHEKENCQNISFEKENLTVSTMSSDKQTDVADKSMTKVTEICNGNVMDSLKYEHSKLESEETDSRVPIKAINVEEALEKNILAFEKNNGKEKIQEQQGKEQEQERLLKERLQKDKQEQEKQEQERLQKEKEEEKEKLQKERQEQERLQQEREEQERLQKEREEQKRLQKEREEQERLQKEREEQEKLQ